MTKISAGPGWYADENDETLERYFNGSRWSDQTRPATDRKPLPTPPPPKAPEDQALAFARRTAEAAESTAASVKALLVITIVLLVLGIAGIVIALN